jgi:hypothetical protein
MKRSVKCDWRSALEVLKGMVSWSREVAGIRGEDPGFKRGEEADLRSG